jgi:hypothetical protein
MFRVARPDMKVPLGWYFDSCFGHWNRRSFASHLSAVFSFLSSPQDGAVHEEQRDESHLDPEDAGIEHAVEIGGQHQDAAEDDERQRSDYHAMGRVQDVEWRGPVRISFSWS